MERQIARRYCNGLFSRQYGTSYSPSPIIQISNGTFYRQHPASVPSGIGTAATYNAALFKNLTFQLPSVSSEPQFWSILGPSSSGKTTFLQILLGQLLCFPPTARSFPYLSSDELGRKHPELRLPSRAIKYVGFGGEEGVLSSQGTRGAYLSARYESRREATDFSVLNYLQGKTELNPAEEVEEENPDGEILQRVIKDLRLGDLVNMPVSNLSNGQTRRAKIARAILSKPEVLLLDEPFMGLDPPTLISLSPLLYGLARAMTPRLVLTLRPQDPIPDWITHLMFLRPQCEIAFSGTKSEVLEALKEHADDVRCGKKQADEHLPLHSMHEIGRTLTEHGILEQEVPCMSISSPSPMTAVSSRKDDSLTTSKTAEAGQSLVEMSGVRVIYGTKTVLGNWEQEVDGETKKGLWWTIRRGQRWGIFGPNGSGKTTVLSLICSDHPQTYSLPILLFGRSRLPELGQPGISIFDIQARIGHSSPEIHHHMPRGLTLRQTIENAWSETFKGIAELNKERNMAVDACLRWFEPELRPGSLSTGMKSDTRKSTSWADDYYFGELPFSAQRVALFLRAVVKKPDLVILDEAFSGMDDAVRDKCMLFLAHGESKIYSFTTENESNNIASARKVVESITSKVGKVIVGGLESRQALLCISHVREEIPGCVREWVCLPEANEGKPARFGKLDGPLEGDSRRWNEIWGIKAALKYAAERNIIS